MTQKCLRYALDMPEICLRDARVMPERCPCYAGDVPEILARLPSPVFDNRARGGGYLYDGNET